MTWERSDLSLPRPGSATETLLNHWSNLIDAGFTSIAIE